MRKIKSDQQKHVALLQSVVAALMNMKDNYIKNYGEHDEYDYVRHVDERISHLRKEIEQIQAQENR